ncbi:MAG: YciI family protein [Verrucomicrobiota bacterium]
MKFMMLMIPRVYQPDTPAAERAGEGFAPRKEELAEMGKFNDELAKAGTIIDIDGLHPLAKGARVAFGKGKPVVTDGPDIEAKEVIGGYWIIELNSKEEAVEWAQRCPAADGDVIEIRPIYEFEDLPEAVRQAANS